MEREFVTLDINSRNIWECDVTSVFVSILKYSLRSVDRRRFIAQCLYGRQQHMYDDVSL